MIACEFLYLLSTDVYVECQISHLPFKVVTGFLPSPPHWVIVRILRSYTYTLTHVPHTLLDTSIDPPTDSFLLYPPNLLSMKKVYISVSPS